MGSLSTSTSTSLSSQKLQLVQSLFSVLKWSISSFEMNYLEIILPLLPSLQPRVHLNFLFSLNVFPNIAHNAPRPQFVIYGRKIWKCIRQMNCKPARIPIVFMEMKEWRHCWCCRSLTFQYIEDIWGHDGNMIWLDHDVRRVNTNINSRIPEI